MPDLWHLQAERECPFPIVFLTDRSIGDMVMSMAAFQILADKFEKVIVTTNIPQLLSAMCPPNAEMHLGWLPYHSHAEVFNISVGSSMNPRYGHPIKQILDHIGLESPAQIPQPRWIEKTTAVSRNPNFRDGKVPAGEDYYIVNPIVYPEYDFLLHVNTDDDDRRWPFEKWAELIMALREEYPDCSIGVLGTDQVPLWNHHKPDPRPFDDLVRSRINPYRASFEVREASNKGDEMAQPGVEYVYNRSFELVGSLVKRAKKAVITIDSSVSRIAHAVEAKNHVILAPLLYPLEWSCHPSAYAYPGAARGDGAWEVDTLMRWISHAVRQDDTLRFGMPQERKVDAMALWELRSILSTWSLWPRNGNIALRFSGGFGAIGSDVDLTRLDKAQVDKLVSLMQSANLFDHISTAVEQPV